MNSTPAAGGRVSIVAIMMMVVTALAVADLVMVFVREHRVRYPSLLLAICFIVIAIAAQRNRP